MHCHMNRPDENELTEPILAFGRIFLEFRRLDHLWAAYHDYGTMRHGSRTFEAPGEASRRK